MFAFSAARDLPRVEILIHEGHLTSRWLRTGYKRPAAEPGVSCPWESLMNIEV